MAKYKEGTYQKGYFHGGSNIDINLITCEDNIVIASIIQSYELNWYRVYLLHPGMDRTEVTISQHLYWSCIIKPVLKEVINCDTFQRTKQLNKKYSKLSAKEAEEIL